MQTIVDVLTNVLWTSAYGVTAGATIRVANKRMPNSEQARWAIGKSLARPF